MRAMDSSQAIERLDVRKCSCVIRNGMANLKHRAGWIQTFSRGKGSGRICDAVALGSLSGELIMG